MDFKPAIGKKSRRVIDNQEAAKSWLAMCGFADLSGDRVTHYFSDEEIYALSFMQRPTADHWRKLGLVEDFSDGRRKTMEEVQGTASQYLLAYALMQFAMAFIPSPQKYREQGLNEGVVAGKIEKSSGSFTSSATIQDQYLAKNATYQTWRLMANMKGLLVESAAMILIRKYGPIDDGVAQRLLRSLDLKTFMDTGEVKEIAQKAAGASDILTEDVISRIFAFLRYVTQQFWEEKGDSLLAQSRIRTVLLERPVAATFKLKLWEIGGRKGLDKAWKPEGKTFLQSLPE
jgi:hypothetical protein